MSDEAMSAELREDPADQQMPDDQTSAQPDSQDQEPDPMEKLAEENETLRQELSELKDQFLRKQADFDNYRKRLLRDKEEGIGFANRKLLEDLLPVIDDFERAIRSSEEAKDFQSLHDGIQLIERQLVSMLESKWGLIRFNSEGKEFDPQRHEAVAVEPRDDHDNQVVVEEFQKGYLLNERVLRSAKVKVSMPMNKGE